MTDKPKTATEISMQMREEQRTTVRDRMPLCGYCTLISGNPINVESVLIKYSREDNFRTFQFFCHDSYDTIITSGGSWPEAFKQPFQHRESQLSIEQWRLDTFGPAKDIKTIVLRAEQEMEELVTLFAQLEPTNPKLRAVVGECADVLIVLYCVAASCNLDLHQMVDLKMNLNRRRKWKAFGDGTGQHIKKE